MMAAALEGPIPGSPTSWSWLATLMLIIPPGAESGAGVPLDAAVV